jgi:hypothetical protein
MSVAASRYAAASGSTFRASATPRPALPVSGAAGDVDLAPKPELRFMRYEFGNDRCTASNRCCQMSRALGA